MHVGAAGNRISESVHLTQCGLILDAGIQENDDNVIMLCT